MIRDPGPISNIGFGVTSRDIPVNEGETEGVSPDAGIIQRALDGHPIAKFFSSAAFTMVGAFVASKLTRQGGLKLAKSIQESADEGSLFHTNVVKNITDIRRHLDELQGVSRYADGTRDPYSRIVFENEGRLTTGYESSISERNGYGFIHSYERGRRGLGGVNESTVVWGMKEELQRRMVRAGRRLPYELPAMYGVQRAITDPLFSQEDDTKKRVNWYNPADVISDFVTTSLSNAATMILPFEFAGATVQKTRSSLHTLKYSLNDVRNLTPIQMKMHKGFVEVEDLLASVGHDFTKISKSLLKKTSQTTGAFNAAAEPFKNSQGPVQTFYSLRHGLAKAKEMSARKNANRYESMYNNLDVLLRGRVSEGGSSIFDLIPGMRGVTAAYREFRREYHTLGRAYDVLEGTLDKNRAVKQLQGMGIGGEKALKDGIEKIKGMSNSPLAGFASEIRTLGGGGPGNRSITTSSFFKDNQKQAFKDLLFKQLEKRASGTVSKTVARRELGKFIDNLDIQAIPKHGLSPTQVVTIGRTEILSSSARSKKDGILDHFGQVISRYSSEISGGDVIEELITADALTKSVNASMKIFNDKNFSSRLKDDITKKWNTFYRQDLATAADRFIKNPKATYSDFLGASGSNATAQALQKRTLQALGFKDESLNQMGIQRIRKELAIRGFDPSDFTEMRSFLVRNRKISSGILSSGGYNIFGFRNMYIDEAVKTGYFSAEKGIGRNVSKSQLRIIQDISRQAARNNPLPMASQGPMMRGVYVNKSGAVLDLSALSNIRRSITDFVAGEFRIPILGFNPADLFGARQFREMRDAPSVQLIGRRSVQPFLDGELSGGSFALSYKTGSRNVGIINYRNIDGKYISTKPTGKFKSVPTDGDGIAARHARIASGLAAPSGGAGGPEFLRRRFGNENVNRIRSFFRIDRDQPNSIPLMISRFRAREADLNNPATIARSLANGGNTSPGNLTSMLRGAAALRRDSMNYGFSDEVMKGMGRRISFMGGNIANLKSEREVRRYASRILKNINDEIPSKLNAAQATGIRRSLSRIESLNRRSNLGEVSPLSQSSTSITTRLDELRNEIFRFVLQTKPALKGQDPVNNLVKIIEVTDDLVRSGRISKSEAAEAQAAGLSTLFNMSAFKTYRPGSTRTSNALNALKEVQDSVSANSDLARLFDPYTTGSISSVGSSLKTRFGGISSFFTRKYGFSRYEIAEDAVNPLGSGQDSTLVPTFGTAFARDPFGAIKSVAGIGTYTNQRAFSGMSIPNSQLVERLNRYFGSIGAQIDVNAGFGGPLNLFATGMVVGRVLPAVVAAQTFSTIDRTAGGMLLGDEDQYGNTVYRPLVLGTLARGAVEAQSVASGLTPGGMSYGERKEQLLEGEVPIRQGRYWPLGNTPFEGGKVMYYRPSYYRKLTEAPLFTDQTFGTPLEKFLYYNDTSPLRPLDPYRFERKHYQDRPYPITGEYFTGQFGPITPFLNMTVGKVLKPQRLMHEEELNAGLASYAAAGENGAYDASAFLYGSPAPPNISRVSEYMGSAGSYPSFSESPGVGTVGMSNISTSFGGSATGSSSGYNPGGMQSSVNRRLASNSSPMATGRNMVVSDISQLNSRYVDMSYGPPNVSGIMRPSIVSAQSPVSPSSIGYQLSDLAYRTQEMAGIYGFGFASVRESLGLSNRDFATDAPVLQSASKAYGAGRSFWDLNLGGLGDMPLPSKEAIGNIEFSEIVRRFIPKERSDINYINPIPNTMASQYPFLPGPEYFTDFTTGDPFVKVQEGELRLPGAGYERMNPNLFSDETGRYGRVAQLDILADVAPYSEQFRVLNQQIDNYINTPEERIAVQRIREQADSITTDNEFSDYEYIGKTSEELGMPSILANINRAGEYIAHSDTFLTNKIFGKRTAIEDYERNNIYGATFPQWQNPIQDFIVPAVQKSTQENPIMAGAGLSLLGSLAGSTPRARLLGSSVGMVTGIGASAYGDFYEFVTGDRFIPERRKQELALDEYMDILTYVKNTRLSNMSAASGDLASSLMYKQAAQKTMYGADIMAGDVSSLMSAIPSRKREHFADMLGASSQKDRERILSTAPRLERRIYQAAWGMRVEKKPDLDEYFERHELPDLSWEGWHPNTNMEHIKIKTGQSMGIRMSEMGYYPQQIREANLTNPSYPDFYSDSDSTDTLLRLRALMNGMGVSGSVTPVYNPFGGASSIDMSVGMR